jgi:hypothetical protein
MKNPGCGVQPGFDYRLRDPVVMRCADDYQSALPSSVCRVVRPVTQAAWITRTGASGRATCTVRSTFCFADSRSKVYASRVSPVSWCKQTVYELGPIPPNRYPKSCYAGATINLHLPTCVYGRLNQELALATYDDASGSVYRFVRFPGGTARSEGTHAALRRLVTYRRCELYSVSA